MIFTAVNRVNFLSNNKWPTRATIGLCFSLIGSHLHRSDSRFRTFVNNKQFKSFCTNLTDGRNFIPSNYSLQMRTVLFSKLCNSQPEGGIAQW